MDSIIFDVDGTLWDSTEIVAESWTRYLQEEEHMNITLTSARLMTLFGQPLADIARQIFPDLPESEQLRIIDGCCQAEHDALSRKCAPLYEDLEKMLEIMYQKYPLYIVSNSQSGYIEVFLQASGLGKYFKGHLCNGDTGLDKGSNIRKIADMYNMKSPVYVGDTFGDYQACRKAGVPFILAEYGFGEVPEPDARISKPMDLVDLSL